MTELGRRHTTENISPIATYREWRMDRKCDFELYPDSIRAAGRHAFGKFETTITLTTLDPNFDRLWVFGSPFYSGAFLFVAGLISLGIVVIGLNRETLDRFTSFVGLCTVVGFVMVLANCRKIELVRFRSEAGFPWLVIGRAG